MIMIIITYFVKGGSYPSFSQLNSAALTTALKTIQEDHHYCRMQKKKKSPELIQDSCQLSHCIKQQHTLKQHLKQEDHMIRWLSKE